MRHLMLLVIVLAGSLGGRSPAACAATNDSTVSVALASGRMFAGQIDETSDRERLVLKTGSSGIELRRPISWSRIVSVQANGKTLTVADLRQRAIAQAQSITPVPPTTRAASLIQHLEAAQTRALITASAEEPATSRVAMLTSYAYVANWDADLETDGLVLELLPLDMNGYGAAVSGTVEVEFYAPQRRRMDLAPRSGGATLELVERWTRSIAVSDFGPGGVRLRLPFGAVQPELDPDWTAWWYGVVHVRLSVPGQGVFEDSRDGVRVRPWLPTRDRWSVPTISNGRISGFRP